MVGERCIPTAFLDLQIQKVDPCNVVKLHKKKMFNGTPVTPLNSSSFKRFTDFSLEAVQYWILRSPASAPFPSPATSARGSERKQRYPLFVLSGFADAHELA